MDLPRISGSVREARRPAAVLAALAVLAAAAAPRAQEVDLGQLSLKRLMDIDVTSVSKSSQRLQDVATSIYVITADDIRRSGATRLQEVLKMAPGVWFSDDSYTVSASAVREYAHPFNLTVLWILDGVPITNPVTGGIIWDVFDLPLSDIDRIEVIKGAGGTIYGANAASGIISIFTKDGESADGFQASVDAGTRYYLEPFVRYGFEPAEDLHMTAWGKYKNHEGYRRNPLFSGETFHPPLPAGGVLPVAVENRFKPAPDDDQSALSYGARFDWRPQGPWRWSGGFNHSFVRSGKYLIDHPVWPDSNPDPSRNFPLPVADQVPGEDRRIQLIVQTRVDRSFGEGHDLFVNASHWRHAFRWMGGPGVNNDFGISDLEIQDMVEAFGRHRFSLGANLRLVRFDFTDLEGNPSRMFADPDRTAWLFGAFAQDEMALSRRLRLTLGAKAETWTLVSRVPEVSPSVRLAYKASERHTFWAAASRSITMPSFSQRDMEFRAYQVPPAWFFAAQGDTTRKAAAGKWAAILSSGEAKPGQYYSVEAGNRGLWGSRLQWDLGAFYSWARDQVSITPFDETLQTVVPSPVVAGDTVTPLYNGNIWQYEVFGGEALARAYPLDGLRLELSYSLLVRHRNEGLPIPGDPQGRVFDVKDGIEEGAYTPEHVGRARIYLDLPHEVRVTANAILSSGFVRGARFDYLAQRPDPRSGVEAGPSDGVFNLDLVLQKAFLRDRLTATLWGRNVLAGDPYVEFYNQYGWSSYPHQVHRTFGGGLDYRF